MAASGGKGAPWSNTCRVITQSNPRSTTRNHRGTPRRALQPARRLRDSESEWNARACKHTGSIVFRHVPEPHHGVASITRAACTPGRRLRASADTGETTAREAFLTRAEPAHPPAPHPPSDHSHAAAPEVRRAPRRAVGRVQLRPIRPHASPTTARPAMGARGHEGAKSAGREGRVRGREGGEPELSTHPAFRCTFGAARQESRGQNQFTREAAAAANCRG